MKFKIILLLFLSSSTYANQADECKIVEETADMIIQMRQGGVDLKKVFDSTKDGLEEHQVQLLEDMIADALSKPVYVTMLGQQKVISEFVADWKKSCGNPPSK
ncbi:hypothetical protein I6M75_18415 [Acinetobacter bereziniae]|nr:hypothetical protein [Acinetobacter bereziniae]MBJ8477014.1 hypothetical protein [Acinetobacter bereziniae]